MSLFHVLIFFLFNKIKDGLCINNITFNNLMLTEHNKYRKIHKVPNLILDNNLIRTAMAYAESLAKRPNNNLEPSYIYQGDDKLGENLFQCNKEGCSINNGIESVEYWYNEIQNYSFESNGGEGVDNFTQIVWKNTKKLGCGIAQKRENNYKVVCHYYPSGNVLGEYKYNVLPPINISKNNNSDNSDSSKGNMTYEEYIAYSFFIKINLMVFLILFL